MEYFILNQISAGGGLSAGYTIVVLFGIVGFLIVAICSIVANHFIGSLKEIKKELQSINDRVDTIEDRNIKHDFYWDNLKNDKDEKLDLILAKLNTK